jgi:hypothetical protein
MHTDQVKERDLDMLTSTFHKKFTNRESTLTNLTLSRAASARMSAQETVALHAFSTCCLAASITSKPRAEFMFPKAFFSVDIPGAASKSMDASQPCTGENYK